MQTTKERREKNGQILGIWANISVDLVTIGIFWLNKLINLCVRWWKKILCKNAAATKLPSIISCAKEIEPELEWDRLPEKNITSNTHGKNKTAAHWQNWLVENDDYRCRFLSARSIWSRSLNGLFFYFRVFKLLMRNFNALHFFLAALWIVVKESCDF